MAVRKYQSAVAGIKPGQARVLVLDIETAPNAAYVWRIWQENIGLNQIEREWHLLSFSAKWLGENKVYYFDQSKAEDIEDDRELLAKLWELLDEADIVIAHNGKKFDVRKINARLIVQGFKPPSPYKIVDTLLIAKAHFAFTSNRLEYLTEKLNTMYKKLDHSEYPGFLLWKAVKAGDRKAWPVMRRYNEFDVLSNEELYGVLRAWDRRHPNVDVHDDDHEGEACPVCGGHHLQKRGFHTTNVGKYQRYVCMNPECGAWSHGRTPINTKTKRKGLLAV